MRLQKRHEGHTILIPDVLAIFARMCVSPLLSNPLSIIFGKLLFLCIFGSYLLCAQSHCVLSNIVATEHQSKVVAASFLKSEFN